MKNKIALFVLLFSVITLFSGCTSANIDDLYSLPQPQTEFLQLQELINAELAAGSEYSAPTQGSLRQSIQLADLDGDGISEALAFFRSRERAPKICIYRNNSGTYELATTINGEGSAIGRVEYADLDGDGISEVLASWRMSTEMRLLKTYSVIDWSNAILFSANCADFQVSDLDKNGNLDAIVLSFDDEGGIVNMYSANATGEIVKSSAKASASLTRADRFRVADIADGVPAVFVEGHYEEDETDWYLTDVLVSAEGKLKNITMDGENGNSLAKRRYQVYSTDIDGNGTMEVPFAEKLFSQSVAAAEYYGFDWMVYNVDGSSSLCASTFHCYNDGWYYVLPTEWRSTLSIRRESGDVGERTIVFSTVDDGGAVEDLMTIYTLTDENRRDKAKLPDRFTLLSSSTIIYAAKLGDGAPVSDEKKQEIISRFHLIYSEWLPGQV